jgi:hypothetical protein
MLGLKVTSGDTTKAFLKTGLSPHGTFVFQPRKADRLDLGVLSYLTVRIIQNQKTDS